MIIRIFLFANCVTTKTRSGSVIFQFDHSFPLPSLANLSLIGFFFHSLLAVLKRNKRKHIAISAKLVERENIFFYDAKHDTLFNLLWEWRKCHQNVCDGSKLLLRNNNFSFRVLDMFDIYFIISFCGGYASRFTS